MADAVVGKAYTFQVLFVDETNTPVSVVDPTITLFTFSQAGVKQVLVDAAPMIPAVPAETGRYTYVYTIPGIFNQGDTIRAEMAASDPVLANTRFLVEEVVTVITLSSGSISGGLISRFVKGG